MELKLHRFDGRFDERSCLTHARGGVLPDGRVLITMQPLSLAGSDIFYGMERLLLSPDFEVLSPITPCPALTRIPLPDGNVAAMCDAAPFYHKKTGKTLLVGHDVIYTADNKKVSPRPRHTVYSVMDENGEFSPFRPLEMDPERFFNAGAGSVQCYEEEDGSLLIPIYFISRADLENGGKCYAACVTRCDFDGEKITVREVGTPLTLDVPRGLCEPSVIRHGGEYFLTMRNDEDGYMSKSADGLHYGKPVPLVFDDGAPLGNYCTQQHFLSGGGKLYLVYTRRGADNDHVFRHRAPLFIAEVDTVTLRVIRATEQVAVPNRGARLGNFGCCPLDERRGLIIASEWMQKDGIRPDEWKTCVKYGSDNSIFVTEVYY